MTDDVPVALQPRVPLAVEGRLRIMGRSTVLTPKASREPAA